MINKTFESIPQITPLTDSQKGIYLECIDVPESVNYNITVYTVLPENCDINRFIESVKKVVYLHPAFFVKTGAPGGVPSMIKTDFEIDIPIVKADNIIDESRAFIKPFDLENGPLIRFEIAETKEETAFIFDVHHIISDGTSITAFINEIASVYGGEEFKGEKITIFDVAQNDIKVKETEEYTKAKEFYKSRLEGVDCDSSLISDIMVDGIARGSKKVEIRAGKKFSISEVKEYVSKLGVNENALFLSAFAYTLAEFNGSREVMFTTVHHGRSGPDFADTFGMFVKTLPIHASLQPEKNISEFIKEMYNEFYLAKKSSVMPFGELAVEYGINAKTTFIYQGDTFFDLPFGDSSVRPIVADPLETIADLDFMLNKIEGEYSLLIHYEKSLYSAELIESFAQLYMQIVCEILKKETLGEINIRYNEADEKINEFNKTEKEYESDTTVVDLFRRQAKATPENTCVVFKDKKYTFREIDEITDRLARRLVKSGIKKETVVGVLINRSEYMPICSLGILKAGGAYLPLDPSYPPERLNYMMKDSGAVMLIESAALLGIINDDFKGERLIAEEIPGIEDSSAPLPQINPDDLFIMLYTSGSTGLPKGVMYQHSNALVSVEFFRSYFGMDETTHLAAYASYGFDANIIDTYPPLICGGELHIIEDSIRLDLIAVRDYFNENGITHSVMTTQIGRQFAAMGGHKTLKHLSVAGEKLAPIFVDDGYNMYNLYGPTEGSVITSAFKIDKRYKDIPIGKPVDNLKAYVVDKDGRLLPPGAVGELWISGAHVTRGYLNRPEKTAEAYGINTFENTPGYERIYRTGDIVRFLADGNLQFVGRRDAQVKIRGFRIELTEVEEVIRRFPPVKDATVAAFDDPSGGKFIAAYVVSDEKIEATDLGDFIRAEKPPYMVPAVIMQIDSIPLNQNHKVNRRALPVPKRNTGKITPPGNDIQKRIFNIISEVVGHSDFGIETNIYEAGLTSIGSVKLNVLLAEEFNIPVKTADIKQNETVIKLESFVKDAAPIKKFNTQKDYPITKTQNGIFIESMQNPDSTVYNIPVLFRLSEKVEAEKLKDAVIAAVNAHPYLKTTLFSDENGDIRARRNDDAEVLVKIIKADSLPEKSTLLRPHKLIDSPLYRTEIYETGSGLYMFLDIHHIICDGTSEAVIFRDIGRAYAGEKLTPESFSGFEAALEEEEIRKSESFEKACEYWKELLTGCENDCLPKKEPGSQNGGAGNVRTAGRLDPAAVDRFCEEAGITANAFFNGVFAFVLSRFINKDELTYSTIFNGRNDSRLAESVSMLVKTVPVTVQFKDDDKVIDFLRAMQNQLMSSMANDSLSFAELAAKYGVNSDIIFAYQGNTFVFDSLCGEKAQLITLASDAAKAPVSMNVYLVNGVYEYDTEYRLDCYSPAFAEALADAVDSAAESFIQKKLIKEITMLSDKAEELYAKLNDSDFEAEPTLIHEYFEKAASKSPNSPAITSNGKSLTYAEMNAGANRIANSLISLGVKKDDIIGLVLERSCEIPMCQMAILKAGGAFSPILPSYPDDRIEYSLTNADMPFVITTQSIKEERAALFAAEKPYKVLTVEELLANLNDNNPGIKVEPEQLAYCIYTSGSTGKPKGVMLEHRNFTNMYQAAIRNINYYKQDMPGSALASCSVSFDASILEIFPPLCSGKHLVMSTDDEFHNPMLMSELMLSNNVQMMVGTPSYMSNLVSMPELKPALDNLKSIVVGAEAFTSALYEGLRSASPNLQIINGYGPTECSVQSTNKILTSPQRITIGRSLGNFKHYVVDKFGNILPPYAVGELIICGAGVGRGYVKLPERNAEAFFTLKGLKAYHSGDIVRLNGDAELDFSGRKDNQIKLRGFRVELDEIEKVMNAYESVKQCKVLVRNNGTEDYLAGFFTADTKVDIESLTAHLKASLTYYMVPAVLMQVESMPLTPNGKIDKNGFPETVKTSASKSKRKAPKKSLEQRLCDIYASVLGLEEVFADDNFFELGGTSLSAAKVTMMLMSDNIEVKYGDIFDNPTPEELSEFIATRDKAEKKEEAKKADSFETGSREALKYNTRKYAKEVKREPLGNVLLTGAVGFLGIHILNELLKTEEGHIWCLVRKGSYDSPEIRLKTMLIYYFSNGFEDELKNRISIIDADITDSGLENALADIPFDTVINCAACVKHFADDDILERINVKGVENLIDICLKRGKKLVQISTVSVPGIHTVESYEKQIKMHENELFVIDDMDNKYGISKYHAELKMFDAVEKGLRGKVIRVGNLMGRHSDGEFQANLETNMFLSGIRGFALMKKYPISHMTDPMRFSPVDCTAKAVVLLAGTNDKFTAFNADNRYGFDEMKIIDACNRNGIVIEATEDDDYYAEFREKLGDDKVNSKLNGLAAYDIKDAHAVETDNLFTTNILYRIGFSWPLVDDAYLDRAINSILTLDYFGMDDTQ